MPALKNTRHEAFAQAKAKGMSSSEAYEKAGYAKDIAHAARLASKGTVKARIEELQAKIETEFVLTRMEWLNELRDIATKAKKDSDYSAARGALREIGLAMPGWYSPEKNEVDGKLEIVIKKL
jgi:phage terminase small subunit